MQPKCVICGHAEGVMHIAAERMFGLGGTFHYFHCARCGCLRLTDPPADWSPYYDPQRYYSLHPQAQPRRRFDPLRPLKLQRNRYEFTGHGRIGRWLARRFPRPDLRALRPWATLLQPLPRRTRILDVGCGRGDLLALLAEVGFTHLRGVDPYLTQQPAPWPHLRIWTCTLAQVLEPTFDLIMFHHSLEHMPDPIGELRAARQRLAPGGRVLVRIPVVSDGPWRRYGTDWAELDAPRHLFLPSRDSLTRAADSAGLRVQHWAQDTDLIAYYGSELYRRGLTLHDPQRRRARLAHEEFDADALARFQQWAQEDARREQAGRVSVVLTEA